MTGNKAVFTVKGLKPEDHVTIKILPQQSKTIIDLKTAANTVLQWDFTQTEIHVSVLAGSGGGIFGTTIIGSDRLPEGTEVRIVPSNRQRRRRAKSLRGVITAEKGAMIRSPKTGRYVERPYVVRHPGGWLQTWSRSEVFEMTDLELLAEAGGPPPVLQSKGGAVKPQGKGPPPRRLKFDRAR
jgi:hypothetical protein